MANVFRCNYIKAALYKIQLSNFPGGLSEKYDEFSRQFPHVNLDYVTFITYYKRFTDSTRSKKISVKEKEEWIEKFSKQKYEHLDEAYRALHTLNECEPCKYWTFQAPSAKRPKPKLPKSLPTSQTHTIDSPDTNTKSPSFLSAHSPDFLPSTPKSILPKTPTTPFSSLQITLSNTSNEKKAASEVLKQINKPFATVYGKLFTDVLPKVPEANLQPKLSASERKQKLRKVQRGVRDSLNKEIAERDSTVLFGTRQSTTQYKVQRSSLYMETPENARIRTEKRKSTNFQ